jgi:hypothetical protein
MSGLPFPEAISEERMHLYMQLNHERLIARDGGPSVSGDAWARIDHLLDILNVIDNFPLVDEGVQS